MNYYALVAVILTYEVFAAFQAEFFRQGITSPLYQKSAFERKIFSSGSNLDLIFSIFASIARINGIAFLIYLGYKTTWWHPVAIWLGGLLLVTVFSRFLRGRTGFTIPALLAFLALPASAIYLWYTVIKLTN